MSKDCLGENKRHTLTVLVLYNGKSKHNTCWIRRKKICLFPVTRPTHTFYPRPKSFYWLLKNKKIKIDKKWLIMIKMAKMNTVLSPNSLF